MYALDGGVGKNYQAIVKSPVQNLEGVVRFRVIKPYMTTKHGTLEDCTKTAQNQYVKLTSAAQIEQSQKWWKEMFDRTRDHCMHNQPCTQRNQPCKTGCRMQPFHVLHGMVLPFWNVVFDIWKEEQKKLRRRRRGNDPGRYRSGGEESSEEEEDIPDVHRAVVRRKRGGKKKKRDRALRVSVRSNTCGGLFGFFARTLDTYMPVRTKSNTEEGADTRLLGHRSRWSRYPSTRGAWRAS